MINPDPSRFYDTKDAAILRRDYDPVTQADHKTVLQIKRDSNSHTNTSYDQKFTFLDNASETPLIGFGSGVRIRVGLTPPFSRQRRRSQNEHHRR